MWVNHLLVLIIVLSLSHLSTIATIGTFTITWLCSLFAFLFSSLLGFISHLNTIEIKNFAQFKCCCSLVGLNQQVQTLQIYPSEGLLSNECTFGGKAIGKVYLSILKEILLIHRFQTYKELWTCSLDQLHNKIWFFEEWKSENHWLCFSHSGTVSSHLSDALPLSPKISGLTCFLNFLINISTD